MRGAEGSKLACITGSRVGRGEKIFVRGFKGDGRETWGEGEKGTEGLGMADRGEGEGFSRGTGAVTVDDLDLDELVGGIGGVAHVDSWVRGNDGIGNEGCVEKWEKDAGFEVNG